MADTNMFIPALLFPASLPAKVLLHIAKDQPILNATILFGVDVIVSGDKHFLNLALERPNMGIGGITPAMKLKQAA